MRRNTCFLIGGLISFDYSLQGGRRTSYPKLIWGMSAQCGIRVNPELSFLSDERYDPCRNPSKLGVPVTDLTRIVGTENKDLSRLTGIHIHSNCDSSDFAELLQTVEHLRSLIPKFLDQVDWINLGGGYLFSEAVNLQSFYEAVGLLRSRHNLEVFVEPGAALVYCPESSRRYFGRLFADSFVALPRKTPGIPASRASLTTKIHPELTPRTSRTAH